MNSGVWIVVSDIRPPKKIWKQVVEKILGGFCLGCGRAESEQKGPHRRGRCDHCYLELLSLTEKLPPEKAVELEGGLIRRGLLLARGGIREIKAEAASLTRRIAKSIAG